MLLTLPTVGHIVNQNQEGNHMAKKPSMKAYEKSSADKKMDMKKGAPKEGSRKDMAADKAGAQKMMAKGAKKR